MTSTVWLFTRPLSYPLFNPLESTSARRDHLRHWGVLVSDLTLIDAQVIMLRTRGNWGDENTPLGTMYELFRDEDDRNNVKVSRPLYIRTIKSEWRAFSSQYIGETRMTSEMIELEGMFPRSIRICRIADHAFFSVAYC